MAVLSHRLGAVWESKLKLREGEKVKSVFSLGSCGLGVLSLGRSGPVYSSRGHVVYSCMSPRKSPTWVRS